MTRNVMLPFCQGFGLDCNGGPSRNRAAEAVTGTGDRGGWGLWTGTQGA